MVIGKGLIASLFINCVEDINHNVVFFASGVSNSLEERNEAFEREEKMLLETINEHSEKKFVYFSTCSIYDPTKHQSKYVLHKLKMENIIKSECKSYLILRVSNATGKGGNPNLLMNYLINAITHNKIIDVYVRATRNIIDTEDIKNITLNLLRNNLLNDTINVAYRENYGILELVELIEKFYNIKARVNIKQEGLSYPINTQKVESYFIQNGKDDKKKYLENILKQYY